MNVDDLIATAQPRTEVVRICARGDLVTRHAEAVAHLRDTATGDESLAGNPATVAAAEAVKAIEDEQDAATVEFTVQAVSRKTWADLLAKHGPSPEDRRAGHDHNPQTFPVAAIAACVKDPELSLDQALKLSEVLHTGEWNKLWVAVVGLNVTGTPSPKLAAATDLLRANEHSSTTPPTGESPEGGSLAGSGEQ